MPYNRYFVSDKPSDLVAIPEFDAGDVISDQPPNVIYIRPKMDYATKSKVTSELFTLGKDNASVEARLGANEMALLVHNIVRWEGPDFVDDAGKPVPCTEENIRRLDPTNPHIAMVADELAKRNKSPNAPTPSASTSAGAPPSRENVSLALATGMPRSTLQSAINGRLSRLDD